MTGAGYSTSMGYDAWDDRVAAIAEYEKTLTMMSRQGVAALLLESDNVDPAKLLELNKQQLIELELEQTYGKSDMTHYRNSTRPAKREHFEESQ